MLDVDHGPAPGVRELVVAALRVGERDRPRALLPERVLDGRRAVLQLVVHRGDLVVRVDLRLPLSFPDRNAFHAAARAAFNVCV